MLYGAYGTTGRLILDEAVRRGHRPILAGRDAGRLAALGRSTGLATRTVPLDDHAALRSALAGVQCVLLAAGPYGTTGPSMRRACLDARCSYLDVNGEIGDFTTAISADGDARAAGIAIIPGAGYGVTFAECLAARVAAQLPAATSLRLSLATQTFGRSRAATLSVAQTMAGGGRDIHRGVLRARPIASPTWRVTQPDGTCMRFAGAPLAELVAVQRSTGIPDVSTGVPLSRGAAAAMRIAGRALGWTVATAARRFPTHAGAAASSDAGERLRSRIWAHAADETGHRAVAMLETGEGYRAAAGVAVLAVEAQLRHPRIGALTPVQAFGPGFVDLVPDTRIQEL
jgi:short subunit dehydrogenase-like uncharacterized protein